MPTFTQLRDQNPLLRRALTLLLQFNPKHRLQFHLPFRRGSKCVAADWPLQHHGALWFLLFT